MKDVNGRSLNYFINPMNNVTFNIKAERNIFIIRNSYYSRIIENA